MSEHDERHDHSYREACDCEFTCEHEGECEHGSDRATHVPRVARSVRIEWMRTLDDGHAYAHLTTSLALAPDARLQGSNVYDDGDACFGCFSMSECIDCLRAMYDHDDGRASVVEPCSGCGRDIEGVASALDVSQYDVPDSVALLDASDRLVALDVRDAYDGRDEARVKLAREASTWRRLCLTCAEADIVRVAFVVIEGDKR